MITSKNIRSLEHSFNLDISTNNHTAESPMTAPGLKSHAANVHMLYPLPPMDTIQNLEKNHIVLKTRFLGKKAIWPVDRQTDWKKEKKTEQIWGIILPHFSLWSRSGPKTGEALSGLSEFYTMIKERSKTAFLCIFLSCGFCKTYDFIMIANDNNSYCLHFLKSKKGKNLLFFI